MKLLVSTTGRFQLIHSEQREHVRPIGFTVIEKSQWAHEKTAIGQLITKVQLGDEATDAEWRDTLRESNGDVELAVASMLDRFPVTEESANKQEPPAAVASATQRPYNQSGAKGTKGSLAPKPGTAK